MWEPVNMIGLDRGGILKRQLNRLVSGAVAVAVMAGAVTGCASTTANPVQVAQVGDDTKSCRAIYNEMEDMRAQITTSAGEGNSQVAKNVGLGVAGAFLLVPWFFMDLGNAHTVEEKAAAARLKRLAALYEDKQCKAPTDNVQPIPATASAATAAAL